LPLKLVYNLPHKYLKDRTVETDVSSLIEHLAGRGLELVFISNTPIAPGLLGCVYKIEIQCFNPILQSKSHLKEKPDECLPEDRFVSCLVSQAQSLRVSCTLSAAGSGEKRPLGSQPLQTPHPSATCNHELCPAPK
jgi:hypothetical protein